MFKTVTPESAGISSKFVSQFIDTLNERGLATHSIILARGENIFAEAYWAPFDKDFCHRMYSQTKSFVSIAIGLLIDDGLLALNDKICDHFPEKIDRDPPENLKNMTIRDMLTMRSCGETPSWFLSEDFDRTHLYLNKNSANIIPGTRWQYDSDGSQVLSSLVEKLSQKSLFDFLNERIFSKLGTFKTASILKTKNDDSFGDSALLCTTRDMVSFASFVMNYGKINGEQIISEGYLKEATSPLVDNDTLGYKAYNTLGYGYQIWCIGKDCFFFNGMGCQMTFCIPKLDLIFSITSDNQGFSDAKSLIVTAFYDIIVKNLKESPLSENIQDYKEFCKLSDSLKLMHIEGHCYTPFVNEINGKKYVCDKNPMGIEEFTLNFKGDEGELVYVNEQGKKVLPFGFDKNVFCKFPQENYSHLHAGLPSTDGYLYDCAVSAAFREEKKLRIKVQIIDKYMGTLIMTFSFKDDRALVTMSKSAEHFLKEYQGTMCARLER